jgi:hypothetical protein
MKPMTNDDLREIEARANAATPGPWLVERQYSGDNWMIGCLVVGTDSGDGKNYDVTITTDHLHASEYGDATARIDAEFVAHARTNVPALIAEVRRLREELAEYQQRERLACGHG